MRRASKRWIAVLLGSGAAVFIAALFAVPPRIDVPRSVTPLSYAWMPLTAMPTLPRARSFARLGSGRSSLGTAARLFHKASDRQYTMLQRDGRF